MFILVEGADGSGKSTLVNELSKWYSIDRKKRPDYKVFFNEEAMESKDEVYIFDRSVISELVYRTFDHEEPLCNFKDLLHIVCNSLIIYCKNKNSYKKSIERGEDNITEKKDAKIISNTYDVIMNMFEVYSLAVIYEYDYEKQDVYDVVKFIEDYKK